jgi:hypothetical protein
MARKRNGVNHEDLVKYYQDKHACFEKRLMGPRGLEKYSAYYVDKAYSMIGGVLPELPWDLIVIQLYTDEGWKSFERWKKTDPEGIKLMKDLGNYSDLKTGRIFACQDNVIVAPKRGATEVSVIDYVAKRSDISHEECINYHREVHAPKVATMLGSKLKKYTAYYIDDAFSLADGTKVSRPFDLITITQLDEEFLKGVEKRHNPEDTEMIKDEAHFVDSKSGVMMLCQEEVFIP